VEDTIQGIEAAIDYDQSDFEIINLGNHQTVTLSELIQSIEKICGRKAIISRQLEQPGDVPQTFANISKAQKLLNYHPKTELETGLLRFYDWYLENQKAV
jgi:UDP-glucuronate 4-epimerase